MSRTLLIVESPNKAKSIRKYLEGRNVVVEATVGHFCDLWKQDLIDRSTWDDVYEIDPKKISMLQKLRSLVKSGGISRVLLASDPDREGEAIAWHVSRELKVGKQITVERIEFHEVGKAAILRAMDNPRSIDVARVDAQRVRRILDRVVGYDVSGLVRRVNAKSAGRVQTPALHILCERERAILAFVPENYWTVAAEYSLLSQGGQPLVAQLINAGSLLPTDSANLQDAAQDSQDATEEQEASSAADKEAEKSGLGKVRPLRLGSSADAALVKTGLEEREHIVRSSLTRPISRKPFAPYTTTTFASDAFRKFGLKTERTMMLAQKGFEAGLWTYHRTDSVHLSEDAIAMFRARIATKHPELLPEKPPVYASKASAQEAHEALRITNFDVSNARFTEAFGADDAADGKRLWLMIGARCLASQCVPALFDKTLIEIGAGDATLAAEGQVLRSPGFLVYWGDYVEVDDLELPQVQVGDPLDVSQIKIASKKTSPPPRYDEASFNSKLEKSGIGRPSTLATILKILRVRGYVSDMKHGKKTVLQPTELGLNVDNVLSDSFPVLVTPEYTQIMEEALDEIAHAKMGRVEYLAERFYPEFSSDLKAARVRIEAFAKEHGIENERSGGAARASIGLKCPKCEAADLVEVSFVPKGKKRTKTFIACDSRDCSYTQENKSQAWRVGACEAEGCGGTLVERMKKDKSGTYWRCAKCDAFGRAEGQAKEGRFKQVEPARECPRCGKGIQMKRLLAVAAEAEGRIEGFDSCDKCKLKMDVDARVHADPCMACGGVVVERKRKDGTGTFFSCSNFPECRFILPGNTKEEAQ